MLKIYTLFVVIAFLMASPAMSKDFKSTEDFASKAAIGNLFEIESSKLALQRSQDADVRVFAQQMIDDHTKASADLRAALAKSKINAAMLPMALDDKHQKLYDDLAKADADDFNDDYIDAQVKAHKETIALFEDYAKDGDSTNVKAFANNTLPSLKMHQENVDKLEDKKD